MTSPLLLRYRIGLLPVTGVFCGVIMKEDKQLNIRNNRLVTDDAIFKATKEIVVKFIEVGRLTPANFEETYTRIFETVKKSVRPE